MRNLYSVQTTRKRLLCILAALGLTFPGIVSGSVAVPHTLYAAPPAQDVDLCALLPTGGRIAVNDSDSCLKTYTEYPAPLDAQIRLIRPENPVPANVAIRDLETMVCRQGTGAQINCAKNSLGDYGFSSQVQYSEFSEYWNRGCYNAHVRTNKYDGESLVLPIAQGIDNRLKTMSPCPPTAAPGRLNVGIGGDYNEASDRVNVTAGVENRPNVGIGDDYYEWALDGAPIQQGKELTSIQFDTSALAPGEHEIVAKVTDRVNNVSGGATYKFTKTKAATGVQPPKPSNPAQIQITTPSGTQTVNSGAKTPVTLSSGKAQIQARCEAVIYGLLTYVMYKEGDDPNTLNSRARALSLVILVQAYCDKLLAAHSMAGGELARPLALQTSQDPGAAIEIEVQEGAGQFEISNSKTAVRFLTANARADASGQQSLIVGYDPATQTTLVHALNGTVNIAPTDSSRAGVTLTGGQQVQVTANGIGPVSSAPAAAQTGQQVVVNAVDNDPDNKLWNCETNRVPFGNEEIDRSRCFTFRYQVPSGGISSAIVNISLDTLGSLQDTDATAMAVGKPYAPCEWGYGSMPGCVVLHGGFEGKHRSLTLNLLDLACDKSYQGSPEAQQLVRDQLQSGVVHMMLEDDTAVYGAQLVLNGGPPSTTCGTSEQPMQTLPQTNTTTGGSTSGSSNSSGGNSTAGGNNTSGGSGVSGATLSLPPFGSTEPYPSVNGRTIQIAQRRVAAGDLVMIPVRLLKADDAANMNVDVTYNANVARPEGNITKGNLLDNALLSANPNESGIVRLGFAQNVNLIRGTGTMAYIPFRAVGKPGDRTTLAPNVTKLNDQMGNALSIDRIPGEIVIVGPNEQTQGDCDGDGTLTTLDALCALEMSVQLRAPRLALDLDNDGVITSRDAAVILQRALVIAR